ncbi:oocyte zinc finger protein XlCOF6 [Lingula anatina]|uniref:Oocyte zinc finger protein XlCOF6 n=1 Tax=Lingula anatina TaxID=7574 RepID=A0A1S3H894_LINAN|nr:oocyte zinc finger protein XlCOF6 [Lingula anatina]|eukprot:XP_013382202.1 oocyte zinc finger protein XlCOF6 [Lingula anatina]
MMGEVIISTSLKAKVSFFQTASDLRSNNRYCDAIVHVGRKIYNAHKLILVSYSKYFADYFRLSVINNCGVVLSDISEEMFSYVLDYMYGQEIHVPVSCLGDLLKTAKKLEVQDLVHQFEKGQFGRREIGGTERILSAMPPEDPTANNDIGSECGTDIIQNQMAFSNSLNCDEKEPMVKNMDDGKLFAATVICKRLEEVGWPSGTQNMAEFNPTDSGIGSNSKGNFFCVSCKSSFPNVKEKCLHFLAQKCYGVLLKSMRVSVNRRLRNRGKSPFYTTTSNHVCYTCYKGFISRSSLVRHIQLKHNKKTAKKFSKGQKGDKKTLNGKQTFKNIPFQLKVPIFEGEDRNVISTELTKIFNRCELCGTQFENAKELVEHQADSHGLGIFQETFHCPDCYEMFTIKELYRLHQQTTHEKNLYICTEEGCHVACSTSRDIILHLKEEHNTDPPFKCCICGHAVTVKQHLKRHIYLHYDQRKKYSCEICNKVYRTEKEQLQHRYSKHGVIDEEKALRCTHDNCSYLTYHLPNLESHLKAKHLNEKNFTCSLCNRKYSSRGSLTAHKLVQHEMRYVCNCPHCGKKAKDKTALKSHLKRCRGETMSFLCTHCEYSTDSRITIESHQYKKHGILPVKGKIYSCDVCDYKCVTNSGMKRHKRAHIGEQ